MRCLALAQVWNDRGGKVTFLSHCGSNALRQRIIDEGFEFVPLEKPHPDSSDLVYTLEILEQLKIQNSKPGSFWTAITLPRITRKRL